MTTGDKLKNQIRLEGFPAKVRARLQLVWRYFQNIAEDSEESARFALFRASDIEIKGAYKMLKEGKSPKIAGRIVDGYFLHEDDLYAIHDSMESILGEIRDIIDSNSDIQVC